MDDFRMRFYRGGDDACFTDAGGGVLNGAFFAHIAREVESPEEACRRELSGEDCVCRFYELCEEAGVGYRTVNIW